MPAVPRSRAPTPATRRRPLSPRGSRDWREETLARLRAILRQADPAAVEERKWKKPSRPEGVPVWSHDGILCVADTLLRSVRLTFPKGAQIRDPTGLFNSRLDSRTVRAVDFHEGEPLRAAALGGIVRDAVRLNARKTVRR